MPATAITEHILYAVTEDNQRHRISEPKGWDAAVAQWHRYDDVRHYERKTWHIGEQPVKFFAVRAEDDPEWPASAPIAEVSGSPVKPAPAIKQTDDTTPLKWHRDRPGRQVSTDGRFAVESDGLPPISQRDREGSGMEAGITGGEWAAILIATDDNLDWFPTMREAKAACQDYADRAARS